MNFDKWDLESDFLVFDSPTLLTQEQADKFIVSAYAVNSKTGLYTCFHDHLYRYDGVSNEVIVENAQLRYLICKKALFIIDRDTATLYLIDSRGVFYQIDSEISLENKYAFAENLFFNNETGFYETQGKEFAIRGRSKKEQFKFFLNTMPNQSIEYNNSWRSNLLIKENTPYLYLTIHNTKKGKIINYICNNILPSEVLTNMFSNDKTINVRIPITSETIKTKAMQFLLDRYPNSYYINGCSLENLNGILNIFYKDKIKYPWKNPKDEESKVELVKTVNLIKFHTKITSDKDFFKKIIVFINSLFCNKEDFKSFNYFSNLTLPYPKDLYDYSYPLSSNIDYINSKLVPDNPITNKFLHKSQTELAIIYKQIYEKSKSYYKKEVESFENEILDLYSKALKSKEKLFDI